MALFGVPQGSALGAILFLLHSNDKLRTFNFIIFIHCADDSLALSERDYRRPIVYMNIEVYMADEWLVTTDILLTSKYFLHL